MAEAIGVASGVSALVITTLQVLITLQKTISSYRGHKKSVCDLLDELLALTQVLSKLNETVAADDGKDFSTLEFPLRRCELICKALYDELMRCLSRSSDSRTSFRDWVRLKSMGEDIDGTRRQLAEFKMTIQIALADANLRESSATTEKIEAYTALLSSANVDIQDHLLRIDEKMDRIIRQEKQGSEEFASELASIEEERLSTEKCLQICTQLSDHISRIRLNAKLESGLDGRLGASTLSQSFIDEGFEGCVSSLSRATSKLEEHERQLFDRMVEKSKSVPHSAEDRIELALIRDQWIATRHSWNIWSTAQSHLTQNVSVIENYSKGNAIQIMASTGERIVHGKNQAFGAKAGQVGGRMSDETIQQSLRMMRGIFDSPTELDTTSLEKKTTITPVDGTMEETGSSFKGKGFQLTSNPSTNTQTVLTKPAEEACRK